MKVWDAQTYDERYPYVWKAAVDLVDLLAPQSGERILDLGCGTGQLTAQIAERGSTVTGLDTSAAMIETAKKKFPKLSFVTGDACSWRTAQPFDAVFSNAVLHWIPNADAVVQTIAQTLKPGGRLVAEFGGHGNIRQIHEAMVIAFKIYRRSFPNLWYFPSIPQYTALLETHGFEVTFAALFDRPTPLQEGVGGWVRMFGSTVLEAVPFTDQEKYLANVEALARPHLFRNGQWFADYRRMRVVAFKQTQTSR